MDGVEASVKLEEGATQARELGVAMARARSEEHGCGRGVACPRAFLPGDEQARWPAPRSGVATPALRGGCQA